MEVHYLRKIVLYVLLVRLFIYYLSMHTFEYIYICVCVSYLLNLIFLVNITEGTTTSNKNLLRTFGAFHKILKEVPNQVSTYFL